MLTAEEYEQYKKAAKTNVTLVYDLLDDLEFTLRNPDMSIVHGALAQHIHDYAKHHKGRSVAFASAVGSINYGVMTADSDLDMKVVYYPSFEDLYFGRNDRFSFVSDVLDCELHPMTNYRKHVLKGNINFFEPLFSETLCSDHETKLILLIMKKLVFMNVGATVLATYFTAEQMFKGIGYVVGDKTDFKKASHAIRLLAFLMDLVNHGEFRLKPSESLRYIIIDIKNGNIEHTEYLDMYESMHEDAKNMIFKRFTNGGDFEFADTVKDMDETKTPEWNSLNHTLDELIMDKIKSEMY